MPKKELDKNIVAYERLAAQERRAKDLRNKAVKELGSYKRRIEKLDYSYNELNNNLHKNLVEFEKLQAKEKRANDLKHIMIVELAWYKDRISQMYALYNKTYDLNVGQIESEKCWSKYTDLFESIIKRVGVIVNVPPVLDEKSVEVNQELLYKQFKESMKKPDEFLCGYTGACGKRLNGRCDLFEPCEKYIPLSK